MNKLVRDALLVANQAPPSSNHRLWTLQQTAEMVAQQLRNAGINAVATMQGLNQKIEMLFNTQFMNDDAHCIVATIKWMGVDKSNIRRVIHFDLPKSIENYFARNGRCRPRWSTFYVCLPFSPTSK
ncbi:helicase-related protein [Vibrio lentus]|nr:helicase-related protein [Vibrio lentus]